MSEINKKRSEKSKLVPSRNVDLDDLQTREKVIEIEKNDIQIFPFMMKDIHVNNEKFFFLDADYINEEIIIDTDVKEEIEDIVTNDKDTLLDNDVGNKQDSQNNENSERSEVTPIKKGKDDNSTEIQLGKDDEITTDKSAEDEDTIDSENLREITNQTNEVISNTTADIEMEDDHTSNTADVCESYNQNSHTMEVEDEDIKTDVSELNKVIQLANTDAQTDKRQAQENTDIVIKKEIDCNASEDSGNTDCDTRKRDTCASCELIGEIVDPEEVKQEDHFEITADAINGMSQVVLTKHTSNCYTFECNLETEYDSKDNTVRELTNSSSELTLEQFILNNSELTLPEIDHYLADETDGKLPLYECQLCSRQFGDSSIFAEHKKIHNLRVMYCDLCKKKFECKKQLIAHIMKHTTAVKGNSDLKRHQRADHSAVPVLYFCVICHKKFRCLKDKLDHEWVVHKESKFKADCPICNKQFPKFSVLERHVTKSHPGQDIDKEMYELLEEIKKSNLPFDEVEKILLDCLKDANGCESTCTSVIRAAINSQWPMANFAVSHNKSNPK